MLICITHNKIISDSSEVLYSQCSLVIVKDFTIDEDWHLELVYIIILTLVIVFYWKMLEKWKERTSRWRTAIPILSRRGCKIRRTQHPFCYSKCFTMCEVIGQRLEKTAIRLWNKSKCKMHAFLLIYLN